MAHTLVAASMLPLLVYLLLHTVHDRVQPNWLGPLYPAFALCAAIAVSGTRPDSWRLQASLATWALGIGFLFCGVIYAHVLRPLPFVPLTKDPTSQTRGWSALAAEADRLRQANGACWIATASYATTAQLAYELGTRTPVIQLDERLRYVHLPPVDDALFKCPALYVELERRAQPEMLAKHFRAVKPLGALTRRYGNKPLASYGIYLLADPVGRPLFD
jgi:hypothetical protein